jgi:hypothetical protein
MKTAGFCRRFFKGADMNLTAPPVNHINLTSQSEIRNPIGREVAVRAIFVNNPK